MYVARKIKCQVEGGPPLFIGVIGDDAARAAPLKDLEANYGEPAWPSYYVSGRHIHDVFQRKVTQLER